MTGRGARRPHALLALAAALPVVAVLALVTGAAEPGPVRSVHAASPLVPLAEVPAAVADPLAGPAVPVAVPPPVEPAPVPPVAVPVDRLAAYRGLGTWVDGYDWAPELGGTLRPNAVREMAAAGVRTLYLQAAKEDPRTPGLLLSPDLLAEWVIAAHDAGLSVQAWYLPTFVEPARDEAHLAALLEFRAGGRGFDTIGLDVEGRDLADVGERNRRLVDLATRLRAATDLPLSAIVVAPVVTEDVNPAYWSPFPWAELAPLFDVWQPMGYYTDRRPESGYRDARAATVANARFLRGRLGDPDAPVHSIGGIGGDVPADVAGFVTGAAEAGALGGSLYDWRTTPPTAYDVLRGVPG